MFPFSVVNRTSACTHVCWQGVSVSRAAATGVSAGSGTTIASSIAGTRRRRRAGAGVSVVFPENVSQIGQVGGCEGLAPVRGDDGGEVLVRRFGVKQGAGSFFGKFVPGGVKVVGVVQHFLGERRHGVLVDDLRIVQMVGQCVLLVDAVAREVRDSAEGRAGIGSNLSKTIVLQPNCRCEFIGLRRCRVSLGNRGHPPAHEPDLATPPRALRVPLPQSDSLGHPSTSQTATRQPHGDLRHPNGSTQQETGRRRMAPPRSPPTLAGC